MPKLFFIHNLLENHKIVDKSGSGLIMSPNYPLAIKSYAKNFNGVFRYDVEVDPNLRGKNITENATFSITIVDSQLTQDSSLKIVADENVTVLTSNSYLIKNVTMVTTNFYLLYEYDNNRESGANFLVHYTVCTWIF